MEFIALLILGIVSLILPFVLTFFNIFNFFSKQENKKFAKIIDMLIFICGILLTVLFYIMSGLNVDYQYALHVNYGDIAYHAPIASWSMPTIIVFFSIGIISYILIRAKKSNLPPLVAIIAMSGNLLGSILCVILIMQLSNNLLAGFNKGIFYLTIFPINYIICSIRAQKELIKFFKEKQQNGEKYGNKFLDRCNNIIMKIDVEKWTIISVFVMVPIAIILIGILTLFGQRPDEFVRAFLETSDWTLSKKYSPPPIEYDAHYLCTVSLRGHKNIVRPLRYGIRNNQKIVVNRQLCVANAFEDLIKERTPKFHYLVRNIYDKYGYPLSKHINTALQADITYILMKPLEYVFLIVLYLFDKEPENRISMQYTKKCFNKIKI